MRVQVLVGVLTVLVACATHPPPPPAPPRTTTMDLAISSVTLKNGLRVVIVRDARAREIQVTMRYAAGAIDDPPNQAGIAHLVEHLMFQQVVGAQSIFAKLESTAREFNAYTSFDATTYTTRASADRLGALLTIEAVRLSLRCTSITPAVFAREREVVINEVRMRDQSTEMVTALGRGAYPAGHPYVASIAGTVASVGAITMEQACAFADAHYGPSNAVLVISGNVELAQVEASLAKFLGTVPRRAVTPGRAVALPDTPHAVETNAPIDDDAVLVAWPLPSEPALRARLVAIGNVTSTYIDALVKGRVYPLILGDSKAEQFAVLISRTEEETTNEILENVEKGVREAPDFFRVRGTLGTMLFNRVQQGAIHQSFSALEEGSDRDTRLAVHVLAGRKPDEALAAELTSLRTFTTQDALQLALRYFAYARANIAVLKPTEETRGATKLSVSAPIHDLGQRRDPPDPADAQKPATEPLATREPEGASTRVLANGMRVILLPLTSVPTVDVRLVFGAGSADEDAGARGAAMVAARGLDWSTRHINDLLNMSVAGGTSSTDVSADRTVFSTNGLDMHIDYLLAGLRRLVREGRYKRGAGSIVESLREAGKEIDDEGALTDAWRAALYGNHAYAKAGLPRHSSATLAIEDAQRFRAAYFNPDNATLVIAGRFDPVLADRWIDYLFADWTGTSRPREDVLAAARVTSLAKDDDISQIQLRIALPAQAGTRAERLIAAAMLADIARDVRHQLGAAYSLDAAHDEKRRSSLYVIAGGIDAPRTHEAIALIKERVEQLRADTNAAARAFVDARRRVLSALTATTGSASILAERVTDDIAFSREPLSDVKLATQVHQLTIGAMNTALADLDLAKAAILMRGPAADVDRAFAVLGRTATRIREGEEEDPLAVERPSAPIKLPDEEELYASDIEDALTLQRRATTISIGALAGYASGKLLSRSLSGPTATAYGILRFEHASIGARASVAVLDGTYPDVFRDASISATPVTAGLYLQTTGIDRVWGGASVGIDFVQIDDDGAPDRFELGFSLGVDAGVDVIRHGKHRLTLFARVEAQLGSSIDYSALSFGAGYRAY